VLPEVRNFIWKLVRNGLLTNENRCHRHIAQDASCEMCFSRSEDCYHATMVCPHAKGLRMAMREFWELPPEEMLHNMGLEWFLALLDSCKPEEVGNLAMILWRAWSVRNKVTRVGEPLMMLASVEYLKRLGQEVQEVIGTQGQDAVPGANVNLAEDQRKEVWTVVGILPVGHQL
jgi:hypothetical protein